ncbi:hypothetical protein GCM10011506_21260 [Marivirga lumbricoides]|uniref:Uncharacterized protein n=1 Tax=Marivirga lumbricoides TaxID=1046115 RepID=A0A2T4DUK5_9BACT|nr:hypothetical protein C9994_02675 [Marivirga lumbricoides]GGC35624.1 hypothetical protein GCM10011506_21260 [Marivirga lumbricoides]
MKARYKKGEIVCDRSRPTQKLFISKCVTGIYYCKVEEDVKRKELVYLERDIIPFRETAKL